MTSLSPPPNPMSSPSSIRASLLTTYTTSLKSFTSSHLPFRILHSLTSPPSISPPISNLYILDSSFNPPTLAHLTIALRALLHDPYQSFHPSPNPISKRLLLLLSTHNADKAPKPASFPHRLAMMQLFATDLLKEYSLQSISTSTPPSTFQGIDIGVTTLPYFADKATAISQSKIYNSNPFPTSSSSPEESTQIHLTGYDTLIRILDPKYYPPLHNLAPLSPFLACHRLLVTYRPSNEWGSHASQDAYLSVIGLGEREDEGAEKKWVTEGRIMMVEGMKEVVSSTRVREAVRDGDTELLGRLVSEGVKDWVLGEGLYLSD